MENTETQVAPKTSMIDEAIAAGEANLSPKLLDSLALEHGTDKSSAYHGYAAEYGRILEPLRRGPRPKAVVEIGVCRKWDGNRHICPSLAMWADWFALAGGPDMVVNVIGLDKCEFGIDDGRILTLVCDQGDAGHLAAARHALKKGFGDRGGVDLIVDDGSHEARHQQMTMKVLWPVWFCHLCHAKGGLNSLREFFGDPPLDTKPSYKMCHLFNHSSHTTLKMVDLLKLHQMN